MRAISPVIATIIIIAVTIAIAVAVAGWMMGLWTGFTSKPALSITQGTLNVTTGNLTLIVRNEGQGDAQLYSITVGNVECLVSNLISSNSINLTSIVGGDSGITNNVAIIKAGDTVRLSAVCSSWKNIAPPGVTIQVKITTSDGSVFTGTARTVS